MADPIRINSTQPVSNQQPTGAAKPAATGKPGAPSFAESLDKAQGIKFSNHAQKRLETRNISLTDESVSRLSNAVDKAEKRGGKSSLVLVDDLAFVVNVRDRMVVTAMDANNRGEGVFTQIDSVVFADPSTTKAEESADNNKDQQI